MSVRPVPELPDAKGFTQDSYVAKEIRAFLRLKCDVAEVTVEGKTCKQIGQAMCSYLKKHANKYPNVRYAVRSGHVYLYLEEER